MRLATAPLIGGAVLLLLLISTSASAAPQGVPALVDYQSLPASAPDTPGGFTSFENLTFQLSPDDPDQTNGSFNYTLWQNDTSYPTGWLPIYNITHASIIVQTPALPVPYRQGWVYYNTGGSWPRPDINGTQQIVVGYNITVRDWSLPANFSVSQPSCMLNVTEGDGGSTAQCGSTISPPSGVSLIVTSVGNATTAGNVVARAIVSPSDPNQTAGNYSYRLYTGYALDTMVQQSFLVPPTVETTGTVFWTTQWYHAGQFSVYAKTRAVDPYTHQVSDFSCIVYVHGGTILQSQYCGNTTNPTGGFAAGVPSFPMADVAGIASAAGVPAYFTADLFGLAFLGGITFLGFHLGGAVVAGGAGVITIAFLALLNIFPLWGLVILVLAALILIVAGFSSGRGGG